MDELLLLFTGALIAHISHWLIGLLAPPSGQQLADIESLINNRCVGDSANRNPKTATEARAIISRLEDCEFRCISCETERQTWKFIGGRADVVVSLGTTIRIRDGIRHRRAQEKQNSRMQHDNRRTEVTEVDHNPCCRGTMRYKTMRYIMGYRTMRYFAYISIVVLCFVVSPLIGAGISFVLVMQGYNLLVNGERSVFGRLDSLPPPYLPDPPHDRYAWCRNDGDHGNSVSK